MEEPNFYLYYRTLRKYFWFILVFTITITIISGVISCLINPVYMAETRILISNKSDRSISSFLSNLNPLDNEGLGAINLLNLGNRSMYILDIISILESRTMSERVIDTLKLEKNEELQKTPWWENQKKSRFRFIQKFQKKIKIIPPSSKDNTVKIKIFLTFPYLAAKIANQFWVELEKYLKEINYLNTTKNRTFIQEQVKKTKQELYMSENKLLTFQQQNNTVSLNEEIKSYIQYLAKLEAETLSAKLALQEIQAKISTTSQKFSPLIPEWADLLPGLEVNKSALKKREQELEEAKTKYQGLLSGLPQKGLLLARLERDVKVQNAIYMLLSQELERAKLEEAKEIEPFRILDKAIVPDIPVSPKKGLILIITFFSSIIFGIFISFLHNYIIISGEINKKLNE